MDPTQAWTQLFEVYTDGDNVWATKDGVLLASQRLGQDLDGRAVALKVAAGDIAEAAVEAAVEMNLVKVGD